MVLSPANEVAPGDMLSYLSNEGATDTSLYHVLCIFLDLERFCWYYLTHGNKERNYVSY